jgi:hypothetical protein
MDGSEPWPIRPCLVEPELVAIDVDVVDGHIATVADERQLAQWQQNLPLPAARIPP